MYWSSPSWLVGLVPWGGLVLWVLLRSPRPVTIPSIVFWRVQGGSQQARRQLHIPPIAVTAILSSIALLIIAAADPHLSTRSSPQPVTLIVDRGITLSASQDGMVRYQQLAHRLSDRKDITVEKLLFIPSLPASRQGGSDWLAQVQAAPPTAINTTDLIRHAVFRELSQSDREVVVLTDHHVEPDNPRVQVMAPRVLLRNIGISYLGVRVRPDGKGELLIRVYNNSALHEATLTITADQSTRHNLSLPPLGREKDYVFSLQIGGDVITASVSPGGDIAADDTAWLLRSPAALNTEIVGAIPADLARFIEIYTAHRTHRSTAAKVLIGPQGSSFSPMSSSIQFAMHYQPADTSAVDAKTIAIESHPVTRHLDVGRFISDLRMTDSPPPSGYKTLATVGGRVILAVSESAPLKIWVGFQSGSFSKDPSFVMFWADVLDWLSGQGEDYSYQSVRQLGRGWQRIEPDHPVAEEPGLLAGIWRNTEGHLIALNAAVAPLTVEPLATDTSLSMTGSLSDAGAAATVKYRPGTSVSRWILVAGALCLVLATATWPRPKLDRG